MPRSPEGEIIVRLAAMAKALEQLAVRIEKLIDNTTPKPRGRPKKNAVAEVRKMP